MEDHAHDLAGIELRCENCGGYHQAAENKAFEDLLRKSCTTISESTAMIYAEFQIVGPGGRWDVDPEFGLIRFTHESGAVACADYQFVGGWIEHSGSFLWGWDHPQKTEVSTRQLEQVRAYGEANGFPVLTTPYLVVAAEDAWHLAKIAAHLLSWPGVYRAKVNDKSWSYFAFAQPAWVN